MKASRTDATLNRIISWSRASPPYPAPMAARPAGVASRIKVRNWFEMRPIAECKANYRPRTTRFGQVVGYPRVLPSGAGIPE